MGIFHTLITFIGVWVLFQLGFFGLLITSPRIQRKLIYYNSPLAKHLASPFEPPSTFGFYSLSRDVDLNEVPLVLKSSDGHEIEAWHITSNENVPPVPIGKKNPLFVFLHGNKTSRGKPARLATYRAFFRQFPGSQLLTIDYRGFAHSSGEPSQEGVMRDVRAAWRYAVDGLAVLPKNIVLVGHSLGSAIATHLLEELGAMGEVPRATILFAAFKNVSSASVDYPLMKMVVPLIATVPNMSEAIRPYIHDQWNSLGLVKKGDLKGPILWQHGTDDSIIPFHHGKSLIIAACLSRDARGSDDRIWEQGGVHMKVWEDDHLGFLAVKGGKHNDMGDNPAIFEAVQHFIDLTSSS